MKSIFSPFLIALLIITSVPALPAGAGISDPAIVVKGFYTWYTKNSCYCNTISARRDDFEPALYESLINAFRKGSDDAVWLDFDPFVNAQVPAKGFSIGKAQLQGPTARITVNLIFSQGERKSLVVAMNKHGGAWKISNFIYSKDSDLVRVLKKVNQTR
jgi:hypothetical protein